MGKLKNFYHDKITNAQKKVLNSIKKIKANKTIVLFFCLFHMISFGQKYDSLSNFLGNDVFKYKGQDLYVLPKYESLKKYGYVGFYTNDMQTIIYKCCDGYNSKYDELAGKYFTVIDVYRHPKFNQSILYENEYFLKLLDKVSNDTIFYHYISDYDYRYLFPFVVIGYITKQRELNIGKKIITNSDQWECIDLIIDKKYKIAMLLQNKQDEKILLLPIIDNRY